MEELLAKLGGVR